MQPERPRASGRSPRSAVQHMLPHEHACLIYETDEQLVGVVVPFLRPSFQQGMPCVCVLRRAPAESVRQQLLQLAPAADPACLTVIAPDGGPAGDGSLPERILGLLRSASPRDQGQMRLALDVSCLFGGGGDWERAMRWELEFDNSLGEHLATGLCAYGQGQAPPDVALDGARAHRLIVIADQVRRNPHHLPPTQLLARDRPRWELQRLLAEARGPAGARTAQPGAPAERHTPLSPSAGAFIKDLQLRYRFADEDFARAVGLPPAEVVGRTDRELVADDVAERWQAADRLVIEAGEGTVRTDETAGADGCRLLLRFVEVPVRDDDDRIVGVLGKWLPAGGAGAGAGEAPGSPLSIRLSPDGTIVDWPAAARRALLYSWEAMLGRPLTALVSPHSRAELREALGRAACGTAVPDRPFTAVRLDGALLLATVALEPVASPGGPVTSIVATVQPMAPQTVEAPPRPVPFRNLIEALPHLTYRLSVPAMSFEYVSPWARYVVGLTAEQLREGGWAELEGRIHPDDVAAVRAGTQRLLEPPSHGAVVRLDYRVMTSEHGWVRLNDERTVLCDGRGAAEALVGVVRLADPARAGGGPFRGLAATMAMPFLTSAAVLLKDGDARYAWGNERDAGYRGAATPAEVIGKSDLDSFPAEMAQRYIEEDRRFLQGARDVPFAVHTVNRDVQGGVWEMRKLALFSPDGDPVGLALLSTQSLSESPEALLPHWAAVVAASEDAVMGLTPDGHILSWNPGAERTYGYAAEEAIGQPMTALAADETRDDLGRALARVAAGHSLRGYETVHARKDGRHMDMSLTMSPVMGAGESVTGISMIARDETDRRRTERALLRSERRFRAILESVRDVAYRLDLGRGTFSYVSPSVEELLGYTPAELISLGARGVYKLVHPDDRRRLGDLTRKLLRQGDPRQVEPPLEYRVRAKTGEYAWVSDARRAGRDGGPQGSVIVGAARDITPRKRAEDALRRSGAPTQQLLAFWGTQIMAKDADGVFMFANDIFAELMHARPEDLVGKTDYDLFSSAAAERYRAADRDVMERGEMESVVRVDEPPRGPGQAVKHEIKVPIKDNKGRALGLLIVVDWPEDRRVAQEIVCHWAALVTASDDAIMGLALDGTILSWNPGAERIYGYSLEDARDQPAGMLYAENCSQALREALARVADGRSLRDVRAVHLLRDGTPIHVAMTMSPILDAEGEVAAVSVTSRDVTDAVRAEQALKESEERFRRVVESAHEGISICRWDPQTGRRRLIFCNDRLVEMSGFTREQLQAAEDLGRLAVSLMSDEETSLQTGRHRQGLPCQGVSSWTRPDGRENVYEWSAIAMPVAGEWQILSVDRDVTERVEAESALRESEERFRVVVESAYDGVNICQTDMETGARRLLFCNDRFVEMSGRSRQELMAAPDLNAFSTSVEPAGPWSEQAVRLLAGLPCSGVASWKRPDGKENIYEWSGVLIKRDGEYHTMGIDRDVTERMWADQQLQRDAVRLEMLNSELERSNRDLEEFTYTVSHDLQEPLRKIHTFAQFLTEDCGSQLGEKGTQHLRRLQDAAVRMKLLIQHLLALARAGGKGTETGPVHTDRLVARLIEETAGDIRDTQAQVRVADGLPVVVGDELQVYQVFQNLLSNSLKFRSPDRPPEVIIEAEPEGRQARFRVRDNGIGIEERFLTRIFGLFERLHPRDKYEGIGIGLALCKKIVHRHGGNIWAESQFGEGTTVHFTLPLAASEEHDGSDRED